MTDTGEELPGDVYVKAIVAPDDGTGDCLVRFTSVAPEAEETLERLRRSS